MKTSPITYILLATSCANEYLESEVDYSLISLMPEYVADILKSMDSVARMHKKDDSIYSLERWDYHAKYCGYNDKFETLQDDHGRLLCDVPRGEPILLTSDPEFVETAFARVECQTLQISPLDVWWTAYVKHTHDRVETLPLAKQVLLDIQRGFKPTENHPA
jgi:hypothetical protein